MKLLSMTDFVFHLRNMTTSELCKAYPNSFKMPVWNGNQSDMVNDMLVIEAIQWRLVGEYAKFLKQPIELWMIVPCDEEGNVLEEPENLEAKLNASEYFTKQEVEEAYRFAENYKKAKERVLFEGFILSNNCLFLNGGGQIDLNLVKKIRVEDIVHPNVSITEPAIKQIGI